MQFAARLGIYDSGSSYTDVEFLSSFRRLLQELGVQLMACYLYYQAFEIVSKKMMLFAWAVTGLVSKFWLTIVYYNAICPGQTKAEEWMERCLNDDVSHIISNADNIVRPSWSSIRTWFFHFVYLPYVRGKDVYAFPLISNFQSNSQNSSSSTWDSLIIHDKEAQKKYLENYVLTNARCGLEAESNKSEDFKWASPEDRYKGLLEYDKQGEYCSAVMHLNFLFCDNFFWLILLGYSETIVKSFHYGTNGRSHCPESNGKISKFLFFWKIFLHCFTAMLEIIFPEISSVFRMLFIGVIIITVLLCETKCAKGTTQRQKKKRRNLRKSPSLTDSNTSAVTAIVPVTEVTNVSDTAVENPVITPPNTTILGAATVVSIPIQNSTTNSVVNHNGSKNLPPNFNIHSESDHTSDEDATDGLLGKTVVQNQGDNTHEIAKHLSRTSVISVQKRRSSGPKNANRSMSLSRNLLSVQKKNSSFNAKSTNCNSNSNVNNAVNKVFQDLNISNTNDQIYNYNSESPQPVADQAAEVLANLTPVTPDTADPNSKESKGSNTSVNSVTNPHRLPIPRADIAYCFLAWLALRLGTGFFIEQFLYFFPKDGLVGILCWVHWLAIIEVAMLMVWKRTFGDWSRAIMFWFPFGLMEEMVAGVIVLVLPPFGLQYWLIMMVLPFLEMYRDTMFHRDLHSLISGNGFRCCGRRVMKEVGEDPEVTTGPGGAINNIGPYDRRGRNQNMLFWVKNPKFAGPGNSASFSKEVSKVTKTKSIGRTAFYLSQLKLKNHLRIREELLRTKSSTQSTNSTTVTEDDEILHLLCSLTMHHASDTELSIFIYNTQNIVTEIFGGTAILVMFILELLIIDCKWLVTDEMYYEQQEPGDKVVDFDNLKIPSGVPIRPFTGSIEMHATRVLHLISYIFFLLVEVSKGYACLWANRVLLYKRVKESFREEAKVAAKAMKENNVQGITITEVGGLNVTTNDNHVKTSTAAVTPLKSGSNTSCTLTDIERQFVETSMNLLERKKTGIMQSVILLEKNRFAECREYFMISTFVTIGVTLTFCSMLSSPRAD